MPPSFIHTITISPSTTTAIGRGTSRAPINSASVAEKGNMLNPPPVRSQVKRRAPPPPKSSEVVQSAAPNIASAPENPSRSLPSAAIQVTRRAPPPPKSSEVVQSSIPNSASAPKNPPTSCPPAAVQFTGRTPSLLKSSEVVQSTAPNFASAPANPPTSCPPAVIQVMGRTRRSVSTVPNLANSESVAEKGNIPDPPVRRRVKRRALSPLKSSEVVQSAAPNFASAPENPPKSLPPALMQVTRGPPSLPRSAEVVQIAIPNSASAPENPTTNCPPVNSRPGMCCCSNNRPGMCYCFNSRAGMWHQPRTEANESCHMFAMSHCDMHHLLSSLPLKVCSQQIQNYCDYQQRQGVRQQFGTETSQRRNSTTTTEQGVSQQFGTQTDQFDVRLRESSRGKTYNSQRRNSEMNHNRPGVCCQIISIRTWQYLYIMPDDLPYWIQSRIASDISRTEEP